MVRGVVLLKPVLERELWSQSESADGLVPPEREDRRAVELAAYLIRADKKIVDVKVIDLSYDGCAVHTLIALRPGEKVKLSVLGRGAVNAVVRWYGSRRAGLLFVPDRVARTHWPRKAERVEVDAEFSLRRSGRLSYRVKAYDVTRFGCRCEFVERPTVYERVWAKFEGLETIEAAVCWVEESSLGLMFKKSLHQAVFDMLLDRMKPDLPRSGAPAA
jgi:hypothetical protein